MPIPGMEMTPICADIGEAAGAVAALAVKHGVGLRRVAIGKMQTADG